MRRAGRTPVELNLKVAPIVFERLDHVRRSVGEQEVDKPEESCHVLATVVFRLDGERLHPLDTTVDERGVEAVLRQVDSELL